MGIKAKEKVKIEWSPNFAYAIGLFVTDGCLLNNRTHIVFTSKDEELVLKFQKALKVNVKIVKKGSGSQPLKKYSYIQIGDVAFCKFLLDIGIMPKKSKIIGEVVIPKNFIADFLRGHFDGDGSFHSYFDRRWKNSYMFYTSFVSASEKHIVWLRKIINNLSGAKGHITKAKKASCYQLKYAKNESLKILGKMYYDRNILCLNRKRLKIEKALGIIGECL